MNGSHSNNGHQINSRLTKPQLRKRLAEALETLRKEETQLETYQKQMQETQAEMVGLKELAERAESAEKELEQARFSMEERSLN